MNNEEVPSLYGRPIEEIISTAKAVMAQEGFTAVVLMKTPIRSYPGFGHHPELRHIELFTAARTMGFHVLPTTVEPPQGATWTFSEILVLSTKDELTDAQWEELKLHGGTA